MDRDSDSGMLGEDDSAEKQNCAAQQHNIAINQNHKNHRNHHSRHKIVERKVKNTGEMECDV